MLKKVEELVAKLPPTQSILLLGRYNYDAMSVGFTGKLDMKDSRIMVKIGDRDIPFLSVHSAKGLEADNVILVNCNQGAYGFPSLIEDDPILDFVLSKKESYPFAEERRLFYVAMTRARMHMYVLYDQSKPSPFISEFKNHPHIANLLKSSFEEFLRRNIIHYDYKKYPVNFVGSIAFYYKDILEKAVNAAGMRMGTVLQGPIDGLVAYHKNMN